MKYLILLLFLTSCNTYTYFVYEVFSHEDKEIASGSNYNTRDIKTDAELEEILKEDRSVDSILNDGVWYQYTISCATLKDCFTKSDTTICEYTFCLRIE